MNKILIVDASESDRRLMSGLLVKSGYEPIAVDSMEAAKEKVAELPPGAVVVAAMKFTGGTALELINWQISGHSHSGQPQSIGDSRCDERRRGR